MWLQEKVHHEQLRTGRATPRGSRSPVPGMPGLHQNTVVTRTVSPVRYIRSSGEHRMLTRKEVTERTVAYADQRDHVVRDDVLHDILSKKGMPMRRSLRRERRSFRLVRQTITFTMNHCPGWEAVGSRTSPRWERVP